MRVTGTAAPLSTQTPVTKMHTPVIGRRTKMTRPTDSRIGEMLNAIDEAENNDDAEEANALYRRPQPPREPSQVYSVRIPVDRLGQLRQVAEKVGVPASALVRRLVLEGLARLTGETSEVDLLRDRVTELEERMATLDKDHTDRVDRALYQLEQTAAVLSLPVRDRDT
jgi:hypothetical protein